MHRRHSRHRRSSSSEGSSPHSTPRHRYQSTTRSPHRSPSPDGDRVDLHCSQESTHFPEDAPKASSSPVTYGSCDLWFRDPVFYQQTLGSASGGNPPPAKKLQTSQGSSAAGRSSQAPAPMDLTTSGRRPSSKNSPKTCPYCLEVPSENLRRHAYGLHVPWYMDPTGSAGLAINPLNNTSPCKTISVSVNKGVSKTTQQNGPTGSPSSSRPLPRSCPSPPWRIWLPMSAVTVGSCLRLVVRLKPSIRRS